MIGSSNDTFWSTPDLMPLGLYRYDDPENIHATMFFYHDSTGWYVCFMIYSNKWSSNTHFGPGRWWYVPQQSNANAVSRVFTGDHKKNLRRSTRLEFLLVTGEVFSEGKLRVDIKGV